MKNNKQVKIDSMVFVLATVLLNSTALAGFSPITIENSNADVVNINHSPTTSKKILNDIYLKEQLNTLNNMQNSNIPAIDKQILQSEINNMKPINIQDVMAKYAGPAQNMIMPKYAGPIEIEPGAIVPRYAGPEMF